MNEQPAQPDDCRKALREQLRPDLFRALCDSNRLTLVARFASANRPLTVTEAGTCCGVHISGVSRHLAMLREAGVLQATKQGREVLYELDCGALASALRQLADALENCRAVCAVRGAENQRAEGVVNTSSVARAQTEEMSDECCGSSC